MGVLFDFRGPFLSHEFDDRFSNHTLEELAKRPAIGYNPVKIALAAKQSHMTNSFIRRMMP
jgi:hypothetical protein